MIFAFLFAPAAARASGINLTKWNVTKDVDAKGGNTGEAVEVPSIGNVTVNADGFIDMIAHVSGAKTSGTKYPRFEFREMDTKGNKAAWGTATGGTMTATIAVKVLPKMKDGTPGHIVIGQIHGSTSDQLCRVYYEGDGTVDFHDDASGPDHKEHIFSLPGLPKIPLNAKLTEIISEANQVLMVSIVYNGRTYKASVPVDAEFQKAKDEYFKAGIYLGENAAQGAAGFGQVTVYGLGSTHP